MFDKLTAGEVIEIYSKAISETAMKYGCLAYGALVDVQLLACARIVSASVKKARE